MLSLFNLPTASDEKGLGTGEFDETIGIEFWKTITGPWASFFEFSKTWTGNPPGLELRNPWAIALGGGYAIRENLLATMSYEESQALIPGNENPRALGFGLSYIPKPAVSLGTVLQFGLSDGAPDILFGLNGSVRFN